MTLAALYRRVLRQLGPDQRTGWGLAFTNVCLAIALFAEPIVFGRVIDTLSKSAGWIWFFHDYRRRLNRSAIRQARTPPQARGAR